MIANYSTFEWSDSVKTRGFYKTGVFTATLPPLFRNFVACMAYHDNALEANATHFVMQHSENAFKDIWNAPEEDVWDSY